MEQAIAAIRARTAISPRVAVVLGSGLGGFAEQLRERVEIPYEQIPGWPPSTAVGHAGRLVLGNLDGAATAVLAGRAHLYEGYTPEQVVFGVRVVARLGVRRIVLTNAAGGINPDYARGALVLISDHINLQGSNPLAGPNDDRLGPRFPDMSEAYPERLRDIAREAARGIGLALAEGVYAAMLGPSYETPAEIRALRVLGADLVGMSTVPEAIAANHMGLEVLAISCVTNMAAGILKQKIDHEEVLETGRMVRATLVELLRRTVPRLAAEA